MTFSVFGSNFPTNFPTNFLNNNSNNNSILVFWHLQILYTNYKHLAHQIVLAIACTIFEPNTYFTILMLFYPNSTYNLTIAYTNSNNQVLRVLASSQ